MKILGRHLVVELSECNQEKLNDLSFLEECLDEAVRRSGATKVRSVFHRYNPQGVSGVVVIAESHISIHTWPEYGYAAVDFFTCGESVDPHRALAHVKGELEAGSAQVSEFKRGIPSHADEIIDHKPSSRRRPTQAAAALR
ncbi:MAG TPA: adenosylmethionine decarboxylase [candidate division Zixibacteria bacterium]|nr:adenosylmethionine decarboxylase [candidate division Zixibacteria bacterium]MDD4916456.1 adenosylmethionine decarboxylase [candidate division Zixibacteria bacterium]MDM7972887.1 adenosylmethionine decarboxylase [candidate division Zixibacteria bacterium]HOD65119.1 adenosylmethionine decarboxylase [candidate division Zixibacteria bacterium]HOZ07450.1 adenosylmethionine decarboxylase [candidate division Zixibacteria bacterium]